MIKNIILFVCLLVCTNSYGQFFDNIDDYVLHDQQAQLAKKLKVKKIIKESFGEVKHIPKYRKIVEFDTLGNILKSIFKSKMYTFITKSFYDRNGYLIEEIEDRKEGDYKLASTAHIITSADKETYPLYKTYSYDSLNRVSKVKECDSMGCTNDLYSYSDKGVDIVTKAVDSQLLKRKFISENKKIKTITEFDNSSKELSKRIMTFYPEEMILLIERYRKGQLSNVQRIVFNKKMRIIEMQVFKNNIDRYLEKSKTKKEVNTFRTVISYIYDDENRLKERVLSQKNSREKIKMEFSYFSNGLLKKTSMKYYNIQDRFVYEFQK